MNAIGIDISKESFTITVLTGDGEYLYNGRKFKMTNTGLRNLLSIIHSLEGDTIVCMEYTGHYYEPVVQFLYENGITTYVVNPILIHRYRSLSIRNSTKKTDPLDSRKIASFIFSNYQFLLPFAKTDSVRLQLKMMNREFHSLEKLKTAMKNHTTALLDRTFPGAKKLFKGAERHDGHQNWVDFLLRFWHAKCVTMYTLDEFKIEYKNWCQDNGYRYSKKKAEKIYRVAEDASVSMPFDGITQDLIQSNLKAILDCSIRTEDRRAKMIEVAKTLPEFPIVRRMTGVSDNAAAQLIAEIGDVQKFANIDNMVAFSGVDPGDKQSGKHTVKSVRISKKGSPLLRKVLYQIAEMLYMQWKKGYGKDDPVTQFIAKKKLEGKEYRVALIAGCDKFMRIYYGTVKKYLADLDAGMPALEIPDNSADLTEDDISEEQVTEGQVQTEHRKRGRPRKNTSETQAQTAPRKRGRPPKNTAEQDQTAPKKTDSPQESQAAQTHTEPPAKEAPKMASADYYHGALVISEKKKKSSTEKTAKKSDKDPKTE